MSRAAQPPALGAAVELAAVDAGDGLAVDRAADDDAAEDDAAEGDAAEDDAEEVDAVDPVSDAGALLLGAAVAVPGVPEVGAVLVEVDGVPDERCLPDPADSEPIVVPVELEAPTSEATGRFPTSSTLVTRAIATAKTPRAVAATTGQRSRPRAAGARRGPLRGSREAGSPAVAGAGRALGVRRPSRSRATRRRSVLRRSDSL